MNCPACGMQMRQRPDGSGFQCDICGQGVASDAGDGHAQRADVLRMDNEQPGVQELNESCQDTCPACAAKLAQAKVADFKVESCARCHGLLLPMGMLQGLVERMRSMNSQSAPQLAAASEDLKRQIACPRCHDHMDTHFYAGPGNVVIDSCETSSLLWLDGGELIRMAHAPDSAQPAPTFGMYDINVARLDPLHPWLGVIAIEGVLDWIDDLRR
jgi:Zn-finger nucleic acid-binding protein